MSTRYDNPNMNLCSSHFIAIAYLIARHIAIKNGLH